MEDIEMIFIIKTIINIILIIKTIQECKVYTLILGIRNSLFLRKKRRA